MTNATIQSIALSDILPSKSNPRATITAASVSELIASVRAHGVLQPVIVRPTKNGKYELVCGHRRFVAAKGAEREDIPAKVVTLTDEEVLEIQLVENLQRTDLNCIEEANGYVELMKDHKYSVERIAERIGKSAKYVYDRAKLRDLAPALRKLVLEGQITPGHAILLARLKPADQTRAMENGLFVQELSDELFSERDKDAKEQGKPVTVRELNRWIGRNVRLDRKKLDAMVFPDAAKNVATAKEKKLEVIAITHEHQLADATRDPKDKTYGPMSWRKVEKEKCEHVAIGVIVTGPGRGESFEVCTAKDQCKTHWGDWQRARKKRRAAAGGDEAKASKDQAARDRVKAQKHAAALEVRRATWKRALPDILDNLAMAVKRAKVSDLGATLMATQWSHPSAKRLMPLGDTADSIVRHLAFARLAAEAGNEYSAPETFPKRAKGIGFDDIEAILKEHVTEKEKTETAAPAKKTSRRKRK